MSILTYTRKPSIIDTNVIKNHINNTIINKLSGKNPATDKFLYTNNQDPYTKVFERDPNCWLNGVNNIGCLCSAQLDGSLPWSAKLVTLISPRHVYFSGHYGPCGFGMTYYANGPYLCGPNPIEVLFTNGNNQVISRKIVKAMLIRDYLTGPHTAGEVVGLLDEDVPQNLHPFAKVLPPNFNNYFEYFNNTFSEPGVNQSPAKFFPNAPPYSLYTVTTTWNQSNFQNPGNELYKSQTLALGKLVATDVLLTNDSPQLSIHATPYYMIMVGPPIFMQQITDDPLSSWFPADGMRVGDSGRPIFVIIENELVLLGILEGGGGGFSDGKLVAGLIYYNRINETMQKLGGNYQLTPIDLDYIYNKYKT